MKGGKQNDHGFKSLWMQFDQEATDKHQLFFKEHAVRNQQPEHPKGRTLFLLNVPPYVTTSTLQRAFSKLCGAVTNVYFTSTKGFRTTYLIFENESSLERALELSEKCVLTLNTDDNICLTGIAKWRKEYNSTVTNEKKLKKEIEVYMENYDNAIADKIAKEKATEEEAAENDGWITVTGQKKRGKFAISRKESAINKVQHKEQQRNKKKQLLNFYTFQIRESKKQNLAELRKKFELDKKRLQELKAKRTFKPF